MPPKLAPTQVVIVPIYKTDEEKASVLEAAQGIEGATGEGESARDPRRARRVQSRVEVQRLGDARRARARGTGAEGCGQAGGHAGAARSSPGREGKVSAPLADLRATIEKLLGGNSAVAATTRRWLSAEPTRTKPQTYDEFKKAVEMGFAFAYWCGSGECEAKIKEETRATMRCIPLDPEAVHGNGWRRAARAHVFIAAKPATQRAIFARAY